MTKTIFVFLMIVSVMCGTAGAAKLICFPSSLEIDCDGDAERIDVKYKGPAACEFELISTWDDSGLTNLSCSDFALGSGWFDEEQVIFDCSPCPGPPSCNAEPDHVHISIWDESGIGVGLGTTIFTIDVWEASPCGDGATIYFFGSIYNCDDPPAGIGPNTWGSCEVTVN